MITKQEFVVKKDRLYCITVNISSFLRHHFLFDRKAEKLLLHKTTIVYDFAMHNTLTILLLYHGHVQKTKGFLPFWLILC